MNKLNKKETLWITGLENQKIDKLKEIFNINKSLTNEEEEEKNENTKDKNFNK